MATEMGPTTATAACRAASLLCGRMSLNPEQVEPTLAALNLHFWSYNVKDWKKSVSALKSMKDKLKDYEFFKIY